MQGRPYKDLIAWQKAHHLCLWTYQITLRFPNVERFRLVNQMCKSAGSVPTNLAEGNAKRSPAEKARFFEIALGSLDELHYQYLLAKDLQYINDEEWDRADKDINNVCFFITKLRASFTS